MKNLPDGRIIATVSLSAPFFTAGALAGDTTNEWWMPYEITTTSQEPNASVVCQRAGTLKDFAITMVSGGANGSNISATIYKNGVATGITVTLGAASTTVLDAASSVVVAAGDYIGIRLTGTLAANRYARFACGML